MLQTLLSQDRLVERPFYLPFPRTACLLVCCALGSTRVNTAYAQMCLAILSPTNYFHIYVQFSIPNVFSKQCFLDYILYPHNEKIQNVYTGHIWQKIHCQSIWLRERSWLNILKAKLKYDTRCIFNIQPKL